LHSRSERVYGKMERWKDGKRREGKRKKKI
jgi:hypothetical protein